MKIWEVDEARKSKSRDSIFSTTTLYQINRLYMLARFRQAFCSLALIFLLALPEVSALSNAPEPVVLEGVKEACVENVPFTPLEHICHVHYKMNKLDYSGDTMFAILGLDEHASFLPRSEITHAAFNKFGQLFQDHGQTMEDSVQLIAESDFPKHIRDLLLAAHVYGALSKPSVANMYFHHVLPDLVTREAHARTDYLKKMCGEAWVEVR